MDNVSNVANIPQSVEGGIEVEAWQSLEQQVVVYDTPASLASPTLEQMVMFTLTPMISAVILTWGLIWAMKYLNRSNGNDKYTNIRIITTTMLCGVLMGALMQWIEGDFISYIIGYDVMTIKAQIGTALASGILAPILWSVFIWFIHADLDIMFIHKKSWPKLYETLRVKHQGDIDYTKDISDNTITRVLNKSKSKSNRNRKGKE